MKQCFNLHSSWTRNGEMGVTETATETETETTTHSHSINRNGIKPIVY